MMKKRLYSIIVLTLLPISVAVRTWQLAKTVDAHGFFLSDYLTVCNLLCALGLAAAAFMLVAGRFFLKEMNKRPVKHSPILGIAALLLAISCIPSAVTAIDTGLLSMLPSLLGAVSFTVIAALQIQGRTVPFVLSTVPVVGEFIRLILHYSQFNGIARISENVIRILFLCSFLGFCLACCRGYSGIFSDKGMKYAYGAGGCAALFGVLCSLPHWLSGGTITTFSVFALGAAIYAATFVTVSAWHQPPIDEPVQQPSEQPVVGIDEVPEEETVSAEQPPLPSEQAVENVNEIFEDIQHLLEDE